jgi:hypothetical protein
LVVLLAVIVEEELLPGLTEVGVLPLSEKAEEVTVTEPEPLPEE